MSDEELFEFLESEKIHYSDEDELITLLSTFRGSEVKSVAVSEGIDSISAYAFSSAEYLESITLPESLIYICPAAFGYCGSLLVINIPDNVKEIGHGTFGGCGSLTSMTVSGGNEVYHSDGNCLIETGSKTLIAGCKNSVIPTDGSVTSIGGNAFIRCNSLTSIIIPDSVTSIDGSVFFGCSGLTRITIADSVTSIVGQAFSDCSKLTDINYNGTIEQWNTIEKDTGWDYNTGEYTIHCTDGDLKK